MIKIENTKVQGFEAAIRGMRNPMNSWEKSDSFFCKVPDKECSVCEARHTDACCDGYVIGENDLGLMMRLAAAGPEHRKFMRFITVTADVTAPLYWWKEYDTYKVGTVANSCSTMHKIHAKEFVMDDFSHEHLTGAAESAMIRVIDTLNLKRNQFLETKEKCFWYQMIQLLPSSYNQRRTVFLNYETLCNIYRQRLNHKLDEWRNFCEWIQTLPESYLMTNEKQSEVKPGGQEEIL